MGKRGNGEGSIYRRKDGRWAGQHTIQTATGPKRKTFYGKTRAEVAARLAKAIAESENGRQDARRLADRPRSRTTRGHSTP